MIESVRVMGEHGEFAAYIWNPSSWYVIRDDRPYLDILVKGRVALPADKRFALESLPDIGPDGARWQRWNLETDLSRERRFGEITLSLKVPKDVVLRCYVVPTSLIRYRDVMAMIEDIASELGVDPSWDVIDQRPDRSWSRQGNSGWHTSVRDLVKNVEDELLLARSLRLRPFSELGPRSRRDFPLPENSVVSHWAMKRYSQLQRSSGEVAAEMQMLKGRLERHNPPRRLPEVRRLIDELHQLNITLNALALVLPRIVRNDELQTSITPSPIFQRDHRLRYLLRAFAPRPSEAISTIESARSSYPPLFLNRLWEVWGAVWIAKNLRKWGFSGSYFLNPVNNLNSCSWRLQRNDVVVEMDYEAHPTFVNYDGMPPVHNRKVPALEWAAKNQQYDQDRPYFGSEEKSSPDYLIRITTSRGRRLMVGDACLASPQHHAKSNPRDAKPYTVEEYRHTIGWVVQGQVIRCDPMGGFVLFPPPADSWARLEQLPGVRDCTLLAPGPFEDEAASERLANLLVSICPELEPHLR